MRFLESEVILNGTMRNCVIALVYLYLFSASRFDKYMRMLYFVHGYCIKDWSMNQASIEKALLFAVKCFKNFFFIIQKKKTDGVSK